MSEQQSDKYGTPRTDALVEIRSQAEGLASAYVAMIEHARQLERELTEALEKAKRWQQIADRRAIEVADLKHQSANAAMNDDEIQRLIATAAHHLRTWHYAHQRGAKDMAPYANTMEVALRLDALVAQLGSSAKSSIGPRTDRFTNPPTEGERGEFVPVDEYNELLASHAQLESELLARSATRESTSELREGDTFNFEPGDGSITINRRGK